MIVAVIAGIRVSSLTRIVMDSGGRIGNAVAGVVVATIVITIAIIIEADFS